MEIRIRGGGSQPVLEAAQFLQGAPASAGEEAERASKTHEKKIIVPPLESINHALNVKNTVYVF
jgi:hypothetical protein